LPFLGINKLMGGGLGYAGEGDAVTAAHMAQMRQLCGAANFTEIFTVDYAGNRMLMMHMQECNPALTRRDRKVRLVRKDFWAPGVQPYVGMYFTLEPGPVTLTCITSDEQGGLYYIAGEGRIVDRQPLAKLDVPHWIVELDEPVGEFLTRYSMAGGPHHLVAVPGHRASMLGKLAHLQGFGFQQL
jgi:L-arabinose isomerase